MSKKKSELDLEITALENDAYRFILTKGDEPHEILHAVVKGFDNARSEYNSILKQIKNSKFS